MAGIHADKSHLAIFASGTGSNADRLCEHFAGHPSVRVALIVSNRADAGVFAVAERHGVPAHHIAARQWREDAPAVLALLGAHGVSHIVLAGFLLLVPAYLIEAYPQRIVNIHPALLPKYGGKGMYGRHVHEAVHAAGETASGISIHYVDGRYDEGPIIFQAACALEASDGPGDIQRKVQALEHQHFPRIVEQWASGGVF